MYNPVNEMSVLQNSNRIAPASDIVARAQDAAFSDTVRQAKNFLKTNEQKLELALRSKTSKSPVRQKHVILAGDSRWPSMVSHNSGNAAAKRRISKARHKKERLVSSLLSAEDTQKTLSCLTNVQHLVLLDRLLLDVRKTRFIY